MQPATKYARSGGLNIAYQVVGAGALDLVLVLGWVTHLEYAWEQPAVARFLHRLASFSRLILFDKRGVGLSDRVAMLPTLEQRMDDVRAVMDAVGSERAAVLGTSEAGPMTALFAATYPERTTALVLYGAGARRTWAPDYPWGRTDERFRTVSAALEQEWGDPVWLAHLAPSVAHDERFRQWWATYLRLGASPGAATTLLEMNAAVDIRHVLPTIHVPTLVLHPAGDRSFSIEEGQYLAERIPGARFVELAGVDHLPYVGDVDALVAEVEEFLTGARHQPEFDRVLATVLFTDIVGSTEQIARLGDHHWRQVLGDYYALVRRELGRFRGCEVDIAGDGFLATFDGPARAIRCASAIHDAVGQLGLEIRAGLHTGECEMLGDKVAGIAVHIGARVTAAASPGETLVTSTVTDLVAGSGIRFEDQGLHTLKGIPTEWRLFRVDRRAHSPE